jgi:hypothetical protein
MVQKFQVCTVIYFYFKNVNEAFRENFFFWFKCPTSSVFEIKIKIVRILLYHGIKFVTPSPLKFYKNHY